MATLAELLTPLHEGGSGTPAERRAALRGELPEQQPQPGDNPFAGTPQEESWAAGQAEMEARTIERYGAEEGAARIAEDIKVKAMSEAEEAAYFANVLPGQQTVGGKTTYPKLAAQIAAGQPTPGTIVYKPTAEELGGLGGLGGVGALGMLATGMLTGGATMANGNGTAQLTAGADPGTSLATTGAKALTATGITAALAALGLPAALAGLIGAGGGYLLGQAVGGGGAATTVGGIPVGGPGVAEPPANMVAKQWVILTHSNTKGNYYIYFFKLIDGRIMCYNPGTGWKIWRPKKMIVLSPDPRMSMIRKLDKVYNRTMRTLAKKTKALKLAH